MSNPKNKTEHFQPNHLGTQPREAGGNKGKKFQNKTGETPQVIQTKGE
jgi:small acid-soluble spore protein N (minor)